MYTIKVVQAPEVIFFDEKEGRDMESIISIDDRKIKIKAEEWDSGEIINYYDINENKKIVGSPVDSMWEDEEIQADDDILIILEKLAYATLYDELGKEGDEFTSEEVLEWDY